MEWYHFLAVVAVGFVAGMINTLAASGSLLTLPLLIALGLPPIEANGTNRIAIFLQNVVAVGRFKQKKVLNIREGSLVGIPAVLGSLIGAQIAVSIDDDLMGKAIGSVLIVMFFVVLFRPNRFLTNKEGKSPVPRWLRYLIFFLIGIYGGFLQAGVGFFLLTGLVLGCGFDLVKANAVKVLIILLYTPFALAVFVLNDQVNYGMGLLLAAGNMLGAWVGANMAVKWGAVFLRYFLLVAILIASLKLLNIF